MSKLKLTNSINSSLQHSISPTCCLFTRTAYPKSKILSASLQRQTASLLNSSDKTNILAYSQKDYVDLIWQQKGS